MKKVKKRRRNKKNKTFLFLISIAFIISLSIFIINLIKVKKEEELEELAKLKFENIKNSYSELVITNETTNIYNENKELIGNISKDTELELDNEYNIIDEYYKLKNEDIYIKYSNVKKIDNLTKKENEYKTYRNYIPYNLELTTKEEYILVNNQEKEIKIKSKDNYKVIIKNTGKYGIEFNNELYYINEEYVSDIHENHYTDDPISTGVAVLNYHYTISVSAGENQECVQIICMTDTQVESHIKYLKENEFYATTLRDIELFVDGMIQLPKKSVTITIDDGWYVARMIDILNRYEMQGTLFLIGSLASPQDYASDYLEIHSHSWDMHKIGICNSGTHGGAILCKDEEYILEDLKKSRESLNNTPYYCFPFYEVNDRAVTLLEKAGFRMSFIGGNRKVKVGDNKFLLPRYQLVNTTSLNDIIRYVN